MSYQSSALVSNTLVCEVSRLINPLVYHYRPYHSGPCGRYRILDLISLIEATVLHDSLVTLPTSSDLDIEGLTLRNKLLDRKILQVLDPIASYRKVASSILEGLSVEENLQQVIAHYFHPAWQDRDEERFAAELAEKAQEHVRFKHLYRSRVKSGNARDELDPDPKGIKFALSVLAFRRPKIDDSYDYWEDEYELIMGDMPESADELAQLLVELATSHGTGAYEMATSLLRDLYYMGTSEALQLPYWPDSARIGFARRFSGALTRPLRVQLYTKLAEALDSTVSEVFDDLGEQVALIPPFSAIVFERSSSIDDVIESILTVREEYSGLRTQFSSLEAERNDATSISQRKKMRLAQKRLLENAARGFESPSKVSLESIARNIPELTSAIATSSAPKKFLSELMAGPVEGLIGWWQRRPISIFFDVANKVQNIEDYSGLIEKIFPNPELGDLDWREYMKLFFKSGR